MKVVVASGKGGTGKTLLATNLARTLADEGHHVAYIDADVEEPNGHLFLSPEGVTEQVVQSRVPYLRADSCSGCGACQKVCAFGAILALPNDVMVLDQLCHGCGACVLACPERVLAERPRRVGVVRSGRAGALAVEWGVVDVGEPRGEPVLEAVLARAPSEPDAITVIDAPPGASCLAIGAVRGADLAVLITEPTPMGLHDLRMALRMVEHAGVRAEAIINRSDLGDDAVSRFLQDEGVGVLAEIPFDEKIAHAYAAGQLPMDVSEGLRHGVTRVAEIVAPAARTEVAP